MPLNLSSVRLMFSSSLRLSTKVSKHVWVASSFDSKDWTSLSSPKDNGNRIVYKLNVYWGMTKSHNSEKIRNFFARFFSHQRISAHCFQILQVVRSSHWFCSTSTTCHPQTFIPPPSPEANRDTQRFCVYIYIYLWSIYKYIHIDITYTNTCMHTFTKTKITDISKVPGIIYIYHYTIHIYI